MNNSTSTDVTFTGAWCNRIVAKHKSCHSTAPEDKQINKYMVYSTSPQIHTKNIESRHINKSSSF